MIEINIEGLNAICKEQIAFLIKQHLQNFINVEIENVERDFMKKNDNPNYLQYLKNLNTQVKIKIK